jgi:molybdenum cofactor cytidylyltransferase
MTTSNVNQRPATNDQRPSAILLSAGESTRMGRPKALLPWGRVTLIEWQIAELRAVGVEDIVVVLGHDAQPTNEALVARPSTGSGPEVRVVINEHYKEGRASSLRTGATALPGDSAGPIVILNVDQPRPRDVHERLLASHRDSGALITVPTSDGKRGHPVIVSGALLPELRAATEEQLGLHGVLEAHAADVHEHPFVMLAHESMANEPDLAALYIRLDVNTPQDYEDALALFGLPKG